MTKMTTKQMEAKIDALERKAGFLDEKADDVEHEAWDFEQLEAVKTMPPKVKAAVKLIQTWAKNQVREAEQLRKQADKLSTEADRIVDILRRDDLI